MSSLARVNDDAIAVLRCSLCGRTIACRGYLHEGDTPNRYRYVHICMIDLTADEIAKLEKAK
jgi:hypothetical protein